MRFLGLSTVKSLILAVILVALQVAIASAQTDVVTDTENCLFCHRYPNMGRYDKSGNKRIYYVNEKVFASSVHGKLRCKSCHVGLDQIPHSNVKKVDCSSGCHIKEPSTGKEFSHSNMVDKFRGSVHGAVGGDSAKRHPEDLPTCKYCHDNPMYRAPTGIWGQSDALINEALARCMGCHTSSHWAERFYSHFTHRMRKRRSQEEIVALCASCHEDQEKMTRHGLESIGTYKDTFHWTQVQYGVRDAPDCISCHVPVGYSAHDIRPRSDRISPINVDNRVKTCSNQGGVQSCHPGATTQFASGRVHAYGMKAQLLASKKQMNFIENQDISLVRERAEKDLSKKEQFHYKVLQLVKLFYKILIAFVIGFMLIHQGLDYMASRRQLKSR
ncbi:MAG: hypothetical protein JSU72_17490 [Deltaproteobacteria bacterium]|nr:MAG: hypothetical protein JSU72_17490 [Deltaproteobacteria bacterium]